MESTACMVESFGSVEEFLASGATRTVACLIVDMQLPVIPDWNFRTNLPEPTTVCRSSSSRAQGTQANRGESGFLSMRFRRGDLLKIPREAIEH
jgi:hypothetical protein